MAVLRACALSLALASCAGEGRPGPTVWLAALDQTNMSALADQLRGADVIVVGEVHDNPIHHLVQADLLRRLRPAAVAFEMLTPDAAADVRAHLAGGGDAMGISDVAGWQNSGWPDWRIYAPVFQAAAGAYIEGGAVPRPALMAAIRSGQTRISDPGLAAWLSRPLPAPLQQAAEKQMIAAHCGKLPEQAAPGMVRAQRLRDASFAAAVLRARQAALGPVILITGSGHARRDRGVPAALARAAPDLRVISVGQVESDNLRDGLPTEKYQMLYDHTVVTQPITRPDPCTVFD